VLKKLDVSVAQAVAATAGGKFPAGVQQATLENGGVGITSDGGQISDEVRAELEPIAADIIGGTLATTGAPTTSAKGGKVCEVTDVGGVDDKSFNQTAWNGAQTGAQDAGWEAAVLESQQQTDYEKNINEFVQSKCDLIVTVGFLLGDATAAAVTANPDQKFMILDVGYLPESPNLLQQTYAVDQAAFLAGYVAASATKTGKVGTFGGINIPPVVDFMVGFENGVAYYNQKHSASVVVLGWSTAANDGLFTGNFESTDDGRRFAETLMDEGADVIMPVAGPVGLGSAAAVQERGNAWIVGVDTDWRVSAPEYADIILTSVLKKLDVSVAQAVAATADGKFPAGVQKAT
ncbi:MAG: BMP family ABC transporter substrate-binding protein, partial [Chloroflexota bacterium]